MNIIYEEGSVDQRAKKNLSNLERQAIVEILLRESAGGKLKYGSLTEVAAKFSVSVRTVSRIWNEAKTCMSNGLTINVDSRMSQKIGTKRIQVDPEMIQLVPLRRRTNLRSFTSSLGMSKTTLHRWFKAGHLRRHSNSLKPQLTEENKKAMLEFCLSMFDPHCSITTPKFIDMYNYVHVDEKWFYMTKETERYYLLPEEMEPLRTVKSKKFIEKIMFLTVVARPRFDDFGNELFSGKIGIFPFIFKEPAKRNSKNRPAGTMVTKAITSVTKDVYRSCLIQEVLPAIRDKWPRHDSSSTIFIQQDNAKPHISPLDNEFSQAASTDGFDIQLCYQPPNSPDMNVLDLGFFRAIQSLQHQEAPKNIDELLAAVKKSFDELPARTLNNVFVTLQLCMIEVMKNNGGNSYKILHIGKTTINDIPTQVCCDRDIIDRAKECLQE